ncbi:MAG TPA: alpha-2-macroglobulin family protein, partial [Ignavibacteriaceae bacterium]
ILAFIADAKTGDFVRKARFEFHQSGKLIKSKITDRDGLVFADLSDFKKTQNSNIQLFGFAGDEIILSDPYLYFNNSPNEYLTAYVYTQQPVYRPGQEVNFKGIFRSKKGNEIFNSPNLKFDVSIKSPKNKEVYSGQAETNEFGSLSGSFFLDSEADLGYYSIIFSKDGISYYGSFTVEEYKKPEYKVNVGTDKNQYANGDKIAVTVSADYYFGSPVKNAQVQVNIYRQNYWRPWWYWSEWAWFYKGFRNERYYGGQQELIHQESGVLNEDGKLEFNYKVESDKNYDYQYIISAQVTDASRRAINGSTQTFVTRGSFTVSTSPDKWFYQQGKEVKLKVNAADFSDKPVQTDFRVIVNYPDDPKSMRMKSQSDTIWAKTNEAGSAVVIFNPKNDRAGYFNYRVIAFDEKEREIEAASSFYIGNVNDYYYQRTNAGLEIITDKDSYEKGDSIIAYIFLPNSNQELLLTYETDKILSYKKLKPEKNSFEIREKLTDKYSPSFNISVSFIKDRMLYQTTKLIGVLAKDKFLNITLTPSKEIYKPAEQAEYEILVKDYLGNPVKNTEVSFGIIDESIYAIKEDETQPIETFFYSPQYSYLPTYNSLQAGYFSSYSRPATYIDKNYFSYKEDDAKHKGKLYGKITIENEKSIPEGLFVILTGEKYYYTAKVDSLGNYKIENAAKGNYQLFISAGMGGMILIDDVKVSGEKKYNFTIKDEQKQQIEDMIAQGVGGMGREGNEAGNFVRGGRQDAAPMAMEMLSSDSKLSKSESKDKSAYVTADVRTNFVDALIWKAQVVTDENGKAKVGFKIPDNLTTWRTTVRGITKQTDVGQSVNKFISRKDLLVRMETPRFFRQDDEVVISSIVHNYLSTKKTTKIHFEGKNLKLISSFVNSKDIINKKGGEAKDTYEISIPSQTELRIDWKVRITNPTGEATLNVSALTDEESDAMEVKVPIIPNGIKVTNPVVLHYPQENVNETIEISIPDNIDIRTATLSLTADPSLAGTMLKALDDLAGYPYGCVEQTMSRFLPTIIVAKTFKEINVPLKSQTIEELPKYVDAGLKRLYDHQHSDGGWGWWTNDQTHPYMTAYVIYGLSLAREAGYEINENVFNTGLNNLKNQISNAKSDIDETTLSYMIYSLSTAMKNQSYDKNTYLEIINILLRKDLKSYPLSLLAITLKNMNQNQKAMDVILRLKKQVNEEKSFAFWGGEEWHYRWQNDNVQGTAFAVKAILNVEGNSDLIAKAVRWLLLKRQGYSWRSTQETSVVLFALTDYLKITKELDPDFSVKIFLNDKKVFEKSFDKTDVFKQSETLKFSGSELNTLKKGNNKLRLEKSGNGVLYLSGLSEYFTEDIKSVENNNGFKVKREYYVLETGEKDGRIIYFKKKFDGRVTSGQDIFVKTFVESKSDNLDYFILEDMLPSGFEVVKDMDKYFIDGENNYQTYYDYYYDFMPWRWHYADREYRDEKVAFFVTSCQKKMEFSYIIKAQIPGDYKIMPAQGYLMYYPELNGFSDVVNIKVNDVQ